LEEIMEMLTIPIVRIGGSKGIRIPKKVLEECEIGDRVVAIVDHGEITLRPEKKSREGWAEAARKVHENGEDELLIDDKTDLSLDEWVW
jgi:antitoxin MazE